MQEYAMAHALTSCTQSTEQAYNASQVLASPAIPQAKVHNGPHKPCGSCGCSTARTHLSQPASANFISSLSVTMTRLVEHSCFSRMGSPGGGSPRKLPKRFYFRSCVEARGLELLRQAVPHKAAR